MRSLSRNQDRSAHPLVVAVMLPLAVVLSACAPAPEGRTDAAAGEMGAEDTAEPMATAAGVEAAFQTFVDAWTAEDAAAVVSMFTADGVVFDPVPPGKFSGSEGIRGLVTGTFEAQDDIGIPYTEFEVRTHRDVAWSTARYTYQATMEGESIAEEGYVSMVWLLQDDGSYRAALFHASPIPVEPMAEGS